MGRVEWGLINTGLGDDGGALCFKVYMSVWLGGWGAVPGLELPYRHNDHHTDTHTHKRQTKLSGK